MTSYYDSLLANRWLTTVRIGQFVLAIAIYVTLLLMPNPPLSGPQLSNFTLHAIGNGLLMLSTWVASGARYNALGPLMFAFPMSLLAELAQGFTENRTPELPDVLANTLGIAVGYVVCTALGPIVKMLRNKQVRD